MAESTTDAERTTCVQATVTGLNVVLEHAKGAGLVVPGAFVMPLAGLAEVLVDLEGQKA